MEASIKDAVYEIGAALRRPEQLAKRWWNRERAPEDAPPSAVFWVLCVNAALGLAGYGLTMGLHLGPEGMLAGAFRAPLAAGLAWMIALPALYIANSAAGSKLDLSTTLLAALITCSFGALAMLAGVPVNWFFTLALPFTAIRWMVNAAVFAGVGICMGDTFLRTMRALEPERSIAVPVLWLMLLCIIGTELMTLLDLFSF